jgi:hypothetical protein
MRRTDEGWSASMKRVIAGLAIAALAYLWLNVEPVYGDCRQTIEGEVCDLIGYEWKGSK